MLTVDACLVIQPFSIIPMPQPDESTWPSFCSLLQSS